MTVIAVSDLTKDYGDVRANDAVSFDVAEGEIFGYLGPNGAGKTTTIRTLMGFQSPTSGRATVLGADVTDDAALVDARRRIGFLPANPAFDEQATGEAILDLHAAVKGDDRRDELLERFEVPVDRSIRGYSTGQVQKLGLVQAFMHDPDLVILDEPTAGLDPLVQRRFNDFIRSEKAAGTTVFLSSHVLSEVRRVCDRIGIIRNGEMITVESVADLLHRAGKFVRARVAADVAPADVTLDGVHELSVQPIDTEYETSSDEGLTELTFTYTGDFDSLVDYLDGFHVQELDVEEAPLEQVFMRFYDDGGSGGSTDAVPQVAAASEATADDKSSEARSDDGSTDPTNGGDA